MTKVLLMGRKQVTANALEYLLSIEGIEIVGVLTDCHLNVSPTRDVAAKYGIPIYEFDAALSALKNGSLKFDLGISILYWKKLKEEFLTVPSRGVINFHPAPLPEYKGTAGYNLAILEGRDTWAATAHYMDEQIDTGGIIQISEFEIDKNRETAQSLERKSQPILFELFESVFQRAISSIAILPFTPNIGGRYVSRCEMESMKEIRADDDISRKIRAFWFPPYDGAYQIIGNEKYTLIDRSILEGLADPTASTLFTEPKC